MNMNILFELLRSDGSIIINKKLARKIGLNEAIMYAELISKYKYFEHRNELTEDGFFYNTVENMEEDTTLTDYQQRKAIKNLVKRNLIQVEVRGIPPRRYFKVKTDNEALKNLTEYLQNEENQQFLKNLRINSEETKELKFKKPQCNNTNGNNTNLNNKEYIHLPKEDAFISFYVNTYREYLNKEHPRVTKEQLNYIEESIGTLQSYDIDLDEWERAVEEHFENLPKSNNGNILAFLKAAARYFEIDLERRMERGY